MRNSNPRAETGTDVKIPAPTQLPAPNNTAPAGYPPVAYKLGDMVATREAYGTALLRIGGVDPRVVAMDGDTKNSTYADKFFKKFPARSTECYIAEQNLVAVAIELRHARQGAVCVHVRDVFHPRGGSHSRGGHLDGEPEPRRLSRRREHRRRRPVANGVGRHRFDARDRGQR